jgi:hypothetical protein
MLVRDRRGAEGVATGLSCPYGIPPPLPLGGFGVGVYVTSARGGIREIWGLLFPPARLFGAHVRIAEGAEVLGFERGRGREIRELL